MEVPVMPLKRKNVFHSYFYTGCYIGEFDIVVKKANELEEEECVTREPIILVLDCEVQGHSIFLVVNHWKVTDKDIDRFGEAMLDAWLKERSTPPMGCVQCNILAREFKSMNICGCEGNVKKKVPRKRLSEACDSNTFKDFCDHRAKVGSFISQAREATLPFLIGAVPLDINVELRMNRKKLPYIENLQCRFSTSNVNVNLILFYFGPNQKTSLGPRCPNSIIENK
ncbi:hypothetical protein L1049_010974 [Liquidambar formosana]|uniref:Uncharacterized protein n=1 Tax=Liquidambar formosana TaxID=63359 RepID=A0AAP0RQT9_LIQFO